MRKTLTSIGDGLGLIIDRTILEQLHIDQDTPLEIETDGKVITIRPIGPEDRKAQVRDAARRMMNAHDETFRKLAK